MVDTDFFGILRDAAVLFPEAKRECDMIQAFRVLQHENYFIELAAQNLGAEPCDIDTVYFYSKPWEKAGRNIQQITGAFPLLTAWEQKKVARNFFANGVNTAPAIGVTVWDMVHNSKNGGCEGCANRSINQVWKDTERLLLTVLDFVKGVILAEVSGMAPEYDVCKTGYYNEDYLKHLKELGQLTTYQMKKQIRQNLHVVNEDLNLYKELGNSDQICGTSVLLNLNFNFCERPKYTFDNIISPISHKQSCC